MDRTGIDRPWRHRATRVAADTVRILLIVYLVIILMFSLLQTWLIFPGQMTQKAADARITRTPPGVELLHLPLPNGTGKIAALFAPALPRDTGGGTSVPLSPPTVIYFYGNASCLNYSWTEISFFRKLGCNVLVPEFVGYGMSPGSPSEAAHYATANAAWAYLQSRKDIDPRHIVIAGWSLGGAAAIDLASRHPDAAGLITLSAFTSMHDMAAATYPWLPSRVLLKHHFENLAKIPNVRCPILLIHGRRDSIVPPTMASQLARAARAPTQLLYLDTVDHNNIFDDSPELRTTTQNFLDALP